MKMVFGFDLHGTIVNSDEAWKSAIIKVAPSKLRDVILNAYNSGVSKRCICTLYNINFSLLEEEYRRCLSCNDKVVQLIKLIFKKQEIILISNGNKERVYKDLQKFGLVNYFSKIYTKEDGDKTDKNYIDHIIKSNNIDLLVYIGNNWEEDVLDNEKAYSLIHKDYHY